ncbi:hypothetical protein [Paenisporosarcina cavernae]|uniref:NodB homology domain-containing protein n=1 Tax=Paenisporosarcina cavernae TaxID=2320858 RepID=A0A385YYZ0_9BACL|nr:hypothetical protein [Paenisporosarcina cavernae]AYC30572.1 hypothetical protein D3873_12355 [Paenisporosarcina cavernae]
MKKLILLALAIFLLLVWSENRKQTLLPTYQIVQEPIELTAGEVGYSLTVDVSFGDNDIEKWIGTMNKPYPLLFLDLAWIERSPEIIHLIQEKKIPVGLLGEKAEDYEEVDTLLPKQLKEFTSLFGEAPLYFRTRDGAFSETLLQQCWKAKVNAIGASKRWNTTFTKLKEGDILQVPLHQKNRIPWEELKIIQQTYTFQTVEETILGMNVTTKSYP